MNYRDSTNLWGASHIEGARVFATMSSHGVEISGGSTGGNVIACGDDANITLNLLPKGTAGVQFGVGSTTPLSQIQRFRVDFTMPALSSVGAAGSIADASTVTQVGLTTNGILVFQQTQVWNSTITPAVIVTARCSTADELRLTCANVSGSTLSGSTVSGNLLQFRF